jgi:hypothetical protein
MAARRLVAKRIAIVLVAVGLLIIATYLYRQFAIDRCLDAGGRWDYANNRGES